MLFKDLLLNNGIPKNKRKKIDKKLKGW